MPDLTPLSGQDCFRRSLNSSRSNGSEIVKLKPFFPYLIKILRQEIFNLPSPALVSDLYKEASVQALNGPWPSQCLLVGSISPSAIVSEMPNSSKGNSPQQLKTQYVQELDLRKSLKKPFLHRPSFCNNFVPRSKHFFRPLMASHHRCPRTELGSSTELPCWLKISLRI